MNIKNLIPVIALSLTLQANAQISENVQEGCSGR
jgi:hypothetical protein